MSADTESTQGNHPEEDPDNRSDLGLLFIHGIGRQKQGQTLVAWLDPLCDWMRNWLSGAARYATRCGVTHEEWSGVFPDLGPEAKRMLQAARLPKEPRRKGRRGLDNAGLHFLTGTLEVEAANVTSTGTIPNARVRMNAIDSKGNLVTASMVAAEAFWQDSFPEPRWKDTTKWLLRISPQIVLFHFGHRVRERWSKLRNWFRERTRPPKARELANLVGSGFLLLLGVTWLLLVVLILPLAQFLLLLLATVGWVPVPGYRHLLSWVQEMIASVLGDAYIFASSPTRLAAVVTQTRQALDWVSSRSRRVIVVAHSQGAAVAYYMLKSGNPPAVAGLVTVGSGLKKLHYLRNLRDEYDLPMTFIVNYALGSAGICNLYLLAGYFRVIPSWLQGWTLAAVFLGILSSLSPLIASLWKIQTSEIQEWWEAQRSTGSISHWLDLYSSHDPVSDGTLFGNDVGAFKSQQVVNEASWIADHTAYWDSADDFVATLGIWISTTANLPIPLHALNDGDEELLERARNARFWRVCFLRFWRAIGYLAAVMFVAAGSAPKVGQAINQELSVHAKWLLPAAKSSTKLFLGLSQWHLGLLALAIGVYLLQLLTKGLWRLWMEAEAQNVCSREPDLNSTVMLAGISSAPNALAAGFALDALFPGYGISAALPFFVFNGVVVWKAHPDS